MKLPSTCHSLSTLMSFHEHLQHLQQFDVIALHEHRQACHIAIIKLP